MKKNLYARANFLALYLIHQKTIVRRALNSPAILADAAMLIAWLSFKEGREAFGISQGISCSCSCSCGAETT